MGQVCMNGAGVYEEAGVYDAQVCMMHRCV